MADQNFLNNLTALYNLYNNGQLNGGQQQQNRTNPDDIPVVSVDNDAAVDMYPVGAGRTVLLINYNARRFWIKTRSENGLTTSTAGHTFVRDDEVAKASTQKEDIQTFVDEKTFNKTIEELKSGIDDLTKKVDDFIK